MPTLPHDASGEPEDQELIARVRRGDHDAFAMLVRRHLPSVRAFVAMKLPVAHLVDEITHETFVFAFQNLAGLEISKSFRAWLRAIAFNLTRRELLRFAREKQNLSKLERMQVEVLLEEAQCDRNEAAFLAECLEALPEGMRRLVHERYQGGKSAPQLAADWRRSSEWVRVTLLRVRRQLRECIEHKIEAHG